MEKINNLIELQFFAIALTIGVYLISTWIYKKLKLSIFHPVLLSIVTIIIILKSLGVNYEQYNEGSQILDFLLGLCVVALGYLLYEQVEHIKANFFPIIISLTIGSIVGIASVIGTLKSLNVPTQIQLSLAPKSVTTPIAIAISEQSGGIPALTAVVVVSVGVFGSIAGPIVLRLLKINSKIAKGLAMGASAHGIGTARAIEMGAIEGAISGLAIGLMGLITALIIPLLRWII